MGVSNDSFTTRLFPTLAALALLPACLTLSGCGVHLYSNNGATKAALPPVATAPTSSTSGTTAPAPPAPAPAPAPVAPVLNPIPVSPVPIAPTPIPIPTPAPAPVPSEHSANLPAWAASGFSSTEGAHSLMTAPIFSVTDYRASGSTATGVCSTSTNSTSIACATLPADLVSGQGIRLVGAGPAPKTFPITQPPVVTRFGAGDVGTHTYCYVVSSVDPLGGITAPSPQTCVESEPEPLAYRGVSNALGTTGRGVVQDDGPTPTFLWYVSEDNGPFQLVSVVDWRSASVDNGQRPGTRGGWPNNLPASNPNISKNEDFFSTVVQSSANILTVSDPIPSAINDTLLAHDDTAAIQNTINAAAAAGGGIVQLGAAAYNVFRPAFHNKNGSHQYYMDYNWFQNIGYLYIPDSSSGHISIQGTGDDTILNTPPDHNDSMFLLDAGQPTTAPPDHPVGIEEVAKGSITIQLTGDADQLYTPQVGDDIQLFSGNFADSDTCQATTGEPATCHFSELNTVLARDGNTLTLAYPTSKRYYAAYGSSFGLLVRTHLPAIAVPHALALQHMTINTFSPIMQTGDVIGLFINDVHITGFISHGAFAGGAKRDITFQDSSWGLGAGDGTWNGSQELDKCVNVLFQGNHIQGYAASGAEGPSMGGRLYATEGSSRFTYIDNTFTNILVVFQQTSDDAVTYNTFNNGEINISSAYGDTWYNWGSFHDAGYLSFASQENALIDHNTIVDDANYGPPVLITMGHFNNGVVTNNTLSYAGSAGIPVLISYGGLVKNNSVHVSSNSYWSSGIALLPDPSPDGPGAPIYASGNTVIADGHIRAAIQLPSPPIYLPSPVCIGQNSIQISSGDQLDDYTPTLFNVTCNDLGSAIN